MSAVVGAADVDALADEDRLCAAGFADGDGGIGTGSEGFGWRTKDIVGAPAPVSGFPAEAWSVVGAELSGTPGG